MRLNGLGAHFDVQMQNVHAMNVTDAFEDLLDVGLNLKQSTEYYHTLNNKQNTETLQVE